MNEQEDVLARAKEALERVSILAADYKGHCNDCKYKLGLRLDPQCSHPIVVANSYLVEQGNRQYATECDYQRKSTGYMFGDPYCGPNGVLFEPNTNKKLTDYLKRLFSKFF